MRVPGSAPDPRPIAALTAAVTVLGAIGALPRWPGLLHLVAVPPLGLLTDLGALLVHAPGIPSFAAGIVVSVVVRSVVLAGTLGRFDRPGVWFGVRFHLLTLPLAFLAASLLYGAKAVLFYALFWAGLAVALLLLAAAAAAPWTSAETVRGGFASAARHGFRLGTLGAYLLLLTGLGALADLGGPAVSVALVPLSGGLTYFTVWFLVADPGFALARRVLAAVPAAGLVAVVVVVATGPAGAPEADGARPAREGSVMLMSGADSRSGDGAVLELDPVVLGWSCEQTHYFSYAGPGDGQPQRAAQCEITGGAPYEPEDSFRSLDELVPFIEQQVAAMEPPAVVLGHSQGVWLLWEAAADGRLDGVEVLVLLGAFAENPVAYPPAGERSPGRVGRLVLEGIALAPEGFTVFEPDMPLGREWLADLDRVETTLGRSLPEDLRVLSVASVFDLPMMPGDHRIGGAVDACPVATIHPNLPYDEEVHAAVVRFLDGEPPPPCALWREAIGPLFRHWAVPGSG